MNFEDLISKCILQVRKECSFFGALMMFAPVQETKAIETAATDGKSILVNRGFFEELNSSEQNALLLHEVLHLALLHCIRRGSRDAWFWNVAADIVVNDLITRNTSFKLPKGAIKEPKYADQSVEEIYEKILKSGSYKKIEPQLVDILKPGDDAGEDKCHEMLSDSQQAEIETYWKDKLQVLKNQFKEFGSNTTGGLPAGMDRDVSEILEPEVDWRHALWKYVGKTPSDFDELDRRFFHRGLYLEGLMTESLEVSVCIDTSGSVSDDLINQFMSELRGIIQSYPHVKVKFFSCDCELAGPFDLSQVDEIPKIYGGGGTSFVPFFKYLEEHKDQNSTSQRAAIYLTDGYEEFPKFVPSDPVLWIVSKDGEQTSAFPFGEVIRISTESWS